MTTWKGTLRSISSAVNAAQRAAVRRQHELERQQKQAAETMSGVPILEEQLIERP